MTRLADEAARQLQAYLDAVGEHMRDAGRDQVEIDSVVEGLAEQVVQLASELGAPDGALTLAAVESVLDSMEPPTAYGEAPAAGDLAGALEPPTAYGEAPAAGDLAGALGRAAADPRRLVGKLGLGCSIAAAPAATASGALAFAFGFDGYDLGSLVFTAGALLGFVLGAVAWRTPSGRLAALIAVIVFAVYYGLVLLGESTG